MENNTKPTIAVITTFYNAEKFVGKAVSSVSQQITNNLFDIEYVIVDDKSKDNSRKIVDLFIKKWGDHFKDVHYHVIEPEKNLGCGGARKFGIEYALKNPNVRYFMFLDSDDYFIHTDFALRSYKEMISDDRPDIIEWGIMFNHPDGTQNPSAVQKRTVVRNKQLAELYVFKDNVIKFNVWSKMYTRAIVESYPYSDNREFEDVRTIPVWVHNANTIILMPSVEINYRAASGSIIRDNMVNTRLGTIGAMIEILPKFKDDYEVVKAMYNRAMVDLTVMLHGHSSENEGFNQMSRYNDEFLKILYPDTWQKMVYHVEDDPEIHPELRKSDDKIINNLPNINIEKIK